MNGKRKTYLCMKKAICFLVTLVLVLNLLSNVSMKVKASEYDDYLVTCSEKEAYEKGYDYYRAWYICDKGNYCKLFYGYNPPYYSLVKKNRNDSSYSWEVTQWRIMTLNYDEIFGHSAKESAYCEAMLFNLLYNEDSASINSRITNGASGYIGDINKDYKNLGFSAWSKIFKGLSSDIKVNAYTKIKDLSVSELEEFTKVANSTAEIGSTMKKFDNAGKLLDAVDTLGEYVDGMCKLSELNKSNDVSYILKEMKQFTYNDAYKNSLDNFSSYMSETVSEDDAKAIFSGTMLPREIITKGSKAVWKAVVKKIPVLMGVEIAEGTATVGKFLSNTLTGNDDQYNKFNELEVYYDLERCLKDEVDNLIYDIDDGDIVAARRFLTAYGMLQNTYNVNMDCYEEYIDKLYKAGLLNNVFPGINSDKYERKYSECESVRESTNNMFLEDIAKAEKAYKAAQAKYEPDSDAGSVETYNSVPENIDESKEIFEENIPNFGYEFSNDTTLDRDIEMFGSMFVTGGELNTNGKEIIIYGDVIATGNIFLNGVINVKGNFYQKGGNVAITGGSSLIVGGNYLQRGGTLSVNEGSLDVKGNHIIGIYDENKATYEYNSTKYYIDNGGEENIDGNLEVIYLNSSDLDTGTLTVGGNIISNSIISGRSTFLLTSKGTDALKIRNIDGMRLKIENAATREITFVDQVVPYELSGGDMTITPENLEFGGILENDVEINGDVICVSSVSLKGKSLIINGNLNQSYGCMDIQGGNLTIKNDYNIAVKTSSGYSSSYSAYLSMNNANDTVNVGNDMLVYTDGVSVLNNGVLSIQGDFTQKTDSKRYNFNATGDHLVVLNGKNLQRITFNTYPDSKFNNVKLEQYEENYLFTPEKCWEKINIYCVHYNKEIKNKVDVTCLEDGYSGDVYCKECGELLEKGQVIKANGHSIVIDEAVEAKCEEAGKTDGRHCSKCGKVFKEQKEIPALGHSWDEGVITTAPTVSETGVKTYTCSVCKQTMTEIIPTIGGQSTPTVEPTASSSVTPTVEPTASSSVTPTIEPASQATPTVVPISKPTSQPTSQATPTVAPTTKPKAQVTPTSAPTEIVTPTVAPSPAVKKDNVTIFSIKNKAKVKASAKIKIKDKDKIKKITLNSKTIKIKKNKTSITIKLKSYKKALKKKGKWNTLKVTDKRGNVKTIKFKTK